VALDKTLAQPHLETPVGIASVEEQPSRFMPGLVIGGNIKDFDAHDSLSSINHVASVLRHAFLRPSYQAGVRAATLPGASVSLGENEMRQRLGTRKSPALRAARTSDFKDLNDLNVRCHPISTHVNE
jgi:hypothetical protein